MIFDLSEKPAVWFDLPGGGKVQLRAPSMSDVLRIETESTENRPFLLEPVNEKGERLPPRVLNHEIQNIEKRARLYNDCTIVGWEGLVDANNKPIPCTPEMKTALMRLPDPTFRDFVREKLALLDEAEKGKAEEQIKNSSAG
ncbi:MAG: hypothetical protein ACYDHW_06965 [Syntrophorhabdaceae bacterium]